MLASYGSTCCYSASSRVYELKPKKIYTYTKPNEERKSADQSQFYMDVERPSFLQDVK